MYIINKYLIKSYVKIFLLSTFGFILILLITRIKHIARFFVITQNPFKVILFTIYQIPHILPFAIPISCLISSYILMQKLSKSFELTALRSTGLSIKKIIFPIILLSFFISLLNFFIISELTTFCRIKTKKISSSEVNLNPIILLERQNFLKIKNSYIDFKFKKNKNCGKNLLFINARERLNLTIAKRLNIIENQLIGKNVSIISYFNNPNNFDNLVIENQDIMTTKADVISKYMKQISSNINFLHLPTKMLLAKSYLDKNKKTYIFSKIEIARRISLSFSAFSLTFIGICFGIEIQRRASKKKIFYAFLLSMLILMSFTVGKAFKDYRYISILIYVLPQIIIILISGRSLKKISEGKT